MHKFAKYKLRGYPPLYKNRQNRLSFPLQIFNFFIFPTSKMRVNRVIYNILPKAYCFVYI